MALANVNIERQTGNIARPPIDQDGVSGLVVFDSNASTSGNYEYFVPDDFKNDFDVDNNDTDDLIYYHVQQYFEFSDYKLYLKVVKSTPSDFSEVKDLQAFAEGDIRQFGILDKETASFDPNDLDVIQSRLDELESEDKAPAVAVYTADVNDVSTLTDLTSKDDYRVSVSIYESLSGKAASLRSTLGSFVSGIGTHLGNISKANVHENIGWVDKFNIVNGDEFGTVGFIDGSKVSDKSNTLLTQLDNYRYTFARKYVGIEGVYHNFSYTAVSNTSDFYSLETNRVYDKAFLRLRSAYLPHVNRPVYVNNSGQLAKGVIEHLIQVGEKELQFLEQNGELSGFGVDIDPAQDILTNNTLEIVALLQPVGVAKNIKVKLGFTLSLS